MPTRNPYDEVPYKSYPFPQLQYLGEADFQVMSSSNFPPQIESMLHSVAGDVIEMEQYMDFVRNRMFRQTLLCRQSVKLDRSLQPDRAHGLYVATSSRPETPAPDVQSREQLKFRRPNSVMSTNEPLVKAAMLHLGESWPLPVQFTELLAVARSRLNPQPVVVDTSRATSDARRLAEPLLRCYGTTHVDLSRTAPSFTTTVGQRPAAAPLARLQAETASSVTNLKHEHVALNDLERQVIQLLDGKRDCAELVRTLITRVRSGALAVHDGGRQISEEDRLTAILGSALDRCLDDLSRKALLHRDSAAGTFRAAHESRSSEGVAAESPSGVDWKDLAARE